MMIRPGLEFIGSFGTNPGVRLVPFIFSTTDTSVLTISSSEFIVRPSSDDFTIKRDGSTATISDGMFIDPALANWTDADETGTTSAWFDGNHLSLVGTRYARAIRRQQISAAEGDHGIAINVKRGKPILRIGSSAGGDDYQEEKTLRPGDYSFSVTSTGDFHIELSANTEYRSLVNSIMVESSGDMAIPTTWATADLGKLRWIQSGDVLFVANYANGAGYAPKRIERHAKESWAIVEYAPEDGPFGNINITNKRLTPSAETGDITLDCDQPLFKSGHVDSLFKITSIGQHVIGTFTAGDQFTDSIRVTGVGESRDFNITVSTASANVIPQVQRAVGEDSGHALVTGLSFSASTSITHNDGLDNQIAFYRIGVPTSDYTSSAAEAELTYSAGGITGIARITDVAASTQSSAIVLQAMGSTAASEL